jgi:8-oxo-dGTP pyrophosphatase MutT (NUDIX family)
MLLRHKVYAYITHGDRLLVFDHLHHPEAGTQLPGGTRPENEDPIEAVLREAVEETGLPDLALVRFLGEIDYSLPQRNEIHRRRFYHLVCNSTPPERWQHQELHPFDETPEPIFFQLYWVDPHILPQLAPGHDACIEELGKSMK